MTSDKAVVASWLEAINRRDIDTLRELSHPDVELIPTEYTAPPGTTFHAFEGVRAFLNTASERFPQVVLDLDELRELDGAVLAIGKLKPEPDDTVGGVERVLLIQLEDGQVRRVAAYASEPDALDGAARYVVDGFRLAFGEAPEPILLLDHDGHVADANPAARGALGLDGQNLGKHAVAHFLAEDSSSWEENWERLRADGQTRGTLELELDDGRRTDLRFWATADYLPGHHLVLLEEPTRKTTREAPGSLTAREREIFELLAQGRTAPQIAEDLVLSPATVRTHVQNGVAKLGATTRVQAIALAVARGEIRVDPHDASG